MTLVQKKK